MITFWVFYSIITLLSMQPVKATANLFDNNEVIDKVDEGTTILPECDEGSICGYLQANTRGINKQRLCSCPDSKRCPMEWDSDDGRSVTQGSDQYKFCEKPAPLTVCNEKHTAYTSRLVYSRSTEQLYAKSDRLLCVCPDDHNYVLAHQNWLTPDPDSEVVEFIYVCARLPECQVGDVCKTLSENGPEFLVNKKCRCPEGLRCPTTTLSQPNYYGLGRGRVNLLKCQH